VRRIEKKILGLNDKIVALVEERRLVAEELSYHRHINDDAQRDAAIGDSNDRSFARASRRDVARFEAAELRLSVKISQLTEKRDHLLKALDE